MKKAVFFVLMVVAAIIMAIVIWHFQKAEPTEKPSENSFALTGINAETVVVTEAVPSYETGREIKNYNTAFSKQTLAVKNGEVFVELGENPVFIELDDSYSRASLPDYEDSPFGFHPSGISLGGYRFADAENIGVKWTREGLYAYWFIVQPDIDTQEYDFVPYDRQFGDIPSGIKILGNIAPQGFIDEGRCVLGTWLPLDEAKYVEFVKATVERYDGDGIDDMPGLQNPIRYWQVGNEPDETQTTGFAQLQQITYQAIKHADPGAVVLIGGVPSGPEGYAENFDKSYAPILEELSGRYIDVFDFHWYGDAQEDYKLKDSATKEDVLLHIRASLTANGFPSDLPIWITEMGSYSGKPVEKIVDLSYQTESQQASDYLKRFVYSLSRGIDKIFPAFGLMEVDVHNNGYFDHTGLIYDGTGSDDLGRGVKKLSYYTYKLMTEKLEGSDWKNIRIISDGKDNIYVYRFYRRDLGKPIYVVWKDFKK